MSACAEQPGSPTAELESWATRWFVLLGAGLVVGVLLPVAYDRSRREPSSWEVHWAWDVLRGAPLSGIVVTCLLLALGIASVAVAPLTAGPRRTRLLLGAAAGTLTCTALLGAERVLEMRAYMPLGAAIGLPLLALGSLSVAVGTRLRRGRPHDDRARLLAGVGGAAACAAYLLPWGRDGHVPLLAALLRADAWQEWQGPWALWMLLLLFYAACGAVALRRAPSPRLYRATSLVGRTLAVGLLVAAVVSWLLTGESRYTLTAAMISLKVQCVLLGPPGILAVALTASINRRLDTATPHPGATAASAEPGAPAPNESAC